MKSMMLISTIISTLFLMSSHPVSMMIVIISQTLIMCILLWLMLNISWFSYIMFLIFLGGIMVLFIYIASLASNEKFKMSFNEITKQIVFTMFMFFLATLLMNSQNIKFIKNEFSEMIFKLYSQILTAMTMFSIFYLIFTLIVVVKLTAFLEGPLRSK